MTSTRIISAVALGLGMVSIAAAQSISIPSPSQGAQFLPGNVVSINVVGQGATLGWTSVTVSAPSFNQTQNFSITNFSETFNVTFNYTVPANVAGTNITINASAVDRISGQTFTASRGITINSPDTTDPGYPTLAVGIISASRVDTTSAQLTWNAATDTVTSGANMRYDVYYSTSVGTVFSSGIRATFTGVTSGSVAGLDVLQDYHFGVRAKDQAGNDENNTVTVLAVRPTAIPVDSWNMYE